MTNTNKTIDNFITNARGLEINAHDIANVLEARVDYIFNNAEQNGRALNNKELRATLDARPIISDLRAIEDKVEQLVKEVCKSNIYERLEALFTQEEA